MEIKGINLWTFLFQILNFFILMLLLSRLLYKPLVSFIQKRREELNRCFLEAERIRKEAEDLKKIYQEKLEELERQKFQILENYRKEAEIEAQKIIEKAEASAERIFQKEKALLEKELERVELLIRERAKELTLRFLEKGIKSLPLEEYHELILKKAFSELPNILKNKLSQGELKNFLKGEIRTAFPLKDEKTLIEIVEKDLGKSLSWEIITDPELLSGIKLKLNGFVVDFSLRAHLKYISNLFEEV